MIHNNGWLVVIMVALATILLSACKPGTSTMSSESPSTVEEIPGSDLKRVVLTEKAAKRLDIQTARVLEERVVQKETVVGEVVGEKGAVADNPNKVWVRVPLGDTDKKMVARDQPARVLPLGSNDVEDSDNGENGLIAHLDEALGMNDDEDEDLEDSALYYIVDSTMMILLPGQRVFVEVPLSEQMALRKVIPYAALIYDVYGGTWVYIKEPNSLSFVRHSVTIDYIVGDLAFLTEGPPENTEVVTVGGAELFGAETGVSK